MIVGSDKDKKKEEKEVVQEKEEVGTLEQLLGGPQNEIRTIGLIGDVDEEKGGDLMMGLLLLTELSGKEAPYEPITMYISTYGGSADEMFGIYDVVNYCKKFCDIETIGLGKVMSAGTLMLASGTKGKRKLGKHCRVMIHAVNGGQVGDIHNLQNELEQTVSLQDSYIQALSHETNMTKRQIQTLINRKVNVYLTAEEAIEKGLADEILE